MLPPWCRFLRFVPALALFQTMPVLGATYRVGTLTDLTARINSAVAGDTIILSNGVYSSSSAINITKVAAAGSPITIQAETIGGVEITGSKGFTLSSPAAYITIQGFKFTHSGNISIASGTSHCRFTRNTIELAITGTNAVSYINISGDDVQIDYNELRNKSTLGEMLDIAGSGSQVARRLWVHHNYFHDFSSPGGNGAETIRWGLSGLSLSTGDGLCEYNLFVRCEGENEMISNKSSGNTYRYNTVLDCIGGEISQRHGNDCFYYGNYMRNSQGMRIYGDRHKIFSNYFESNSVGVNMGNGDGDVYAGDPLTSHDRPDDNVVVYNTFVGNGTHYEMGGRTGGLGSSNTVVANNIFYSGGTMASISSSAPYTGTWSNNIRWQTSSAGNMPASGYSTVNPLLAPDVSGVYHIQAGSPAINAGKGAYDFYAVFSTLPYVTNDLDGQPRDATPDTGADEFSGAPITAKFLTTNDVGPNAGLSSFNLAASPASRSVQPGSFSNVTYTITVTDLSGSNAVVTLLTSGLPSATAAAFSRPSVTGSGSSTLTVTVSNTAPMGTYPLVVTGTNASSTNSATALLIIARPSASLRWAGTTSSVWDVASSANWFNLSNNTSDVFLQGDTVLFDDAPGLTGSVVLSASVLPAAVTNDSSLRDYTLSGPGVISGSASLVKKGTSTLTINTTNDFTGTVTVLGGTLKVGSSGALGSAIGTTIVAGGTLDVNGINFTGEPVTASGGGAAAQGALVNNGPQQTSALRNVTLSGDTTFGGTGRWDIRAASSSSTNGCSLVSSGQPYKITKVGTNQVSLVAVCVDPGLGDIDVREGVFGIQTVTSQVGNPARTISVSPGATLELWNLNTAPLNKHVVLSNTASLWNESGSSIVVGPVLLTNGTSTFNVGGTSLMLSNNVLSGAGGLSKTGSGTLILAGANTYTGPTLVSTGTLALVNSGSLGASSTISIAGGATLDVSARIDNKLTLAGGQTLSGSGTVNGSLLVSSGATLSPGAPVGALTVTNAVTLQGTTFMELDKLAGTNDVISGSAGIVYGGVLSLTNLSGSLTTNDSFKLFSAGSYSGVFASLSPTVPGPNLAWNTNTLVNDGTLRIVSAPSQPAFSTIRCIGTSCVLSGTNGPPGGGYSVLGSPELSLPLGQWQIVGTNSFDSQGAFSFTNTSQFPQQFYRLSVNGP